MKTKKRQLKTEFLTRTVDQGVNKVLTLSQKIVKNFNTELLKKDN